MKKVPLFFSILLVATSCNYPPHPASDQKFESKQDNNSTNNEQGNPFSKNMQCASLESTNKNKVAAEYSNNRLEKIEEFYNFYNTEKDTCLYAFKAFKALCGINNGCPNLSDYDVHIEFGIYDINGQKIYFKSTPAGQQVTSTQEEFDGLLQKYNK